jgi:YgiT-type zinc finger domain-containing protein
MARSSDTKDVDDLCLCGRGKLHEGFTELRIRVEDALLVIKNVPARVCNLCDEAYISPNTSRQIDEIMAKYRTGRLPAKPIQAEEIDLMQTAWAVFSLRENKISDVPNSMKIPRSDPDQVLKLELVVALYRRGILAMGPARRLAGISKREFLEELGNRKIERHYTLAELEKDVAFAKGDIFNFENINKFYTT